MTELIESHRTSFYFDPEDFTLLSMVNSLIEGDWSDAERKLFPESLHPHGIKELDAPRDLRIAHTVINLLHSLEEGEASERLQALSLLYDEVVSVSDSSFRYNTGRVLIQIMKELVENKGDVDTQLKLAHVFRKAARANRRFVRKVLRHYQLLEMPESNNQVSFDNHVHDSHTKGRKTASHLIMDAWVEGIRSLTVIYYNYIELNTVKELLQAADIMGISVQIGIEFRAVFQKRYVTAVWEPFGIGDVQSLENFLNLEQVKELMNDGRAASDYYAKNVYSMLSYYNQTLRSSMSLHYNIDMPEIPREELLQFVASGQPSLLHLADLISQHLHSRLSKLFSSLKEQYNDSSVKSKDKKIIEDQVSKMQGLSPEYILDNWLTAKKEVTLPNPTLPRDNSDAPPILKISAETLFERLSNIGRRANISLSLYNLSLSDVLELLYEGKGAVTHLELYNRKYVLAGKTAYLEDISKLQYSINKGNSIVLKRLVLDLIRKSKNDDSLESKTILTKILYNIPQLQSFYRNSVIKTRIGSDSTSRSHSHQGMGFAAIQTLPKRARKEVLSSKNNVRTVLPIEAKVDAIFVYSPPASREYYFLGKVLGLIRKIPGFSLFGYDKKRSWKVCQDSYLYSEKAKSIVSLGVKQKKIKDLDYDLHPKAYKKERPSLFYCNTRLVNYLKVSIGFCMAMTSFLFTQDLWFLAWFGAPIWFGITGARNIIQTLFAGKDINHTSLLHWKDYVNWSRVSDSLFYTGFSVPLLEVFLRWGILENVFNITSESNPLVFFTVISTANGLYIASHNFLRGLQNEVVVANLFRSVVSVPLSLLYNVVFIYILSLIGFGGATALIAAGATITSKAASDTVAGLIEGVADQYTNLNMRRWDYSKKLKQLFACYSRLELLLPEENVLTLLGKKGTPFADASTEVGKLERTILVHSLDLLYFFFYQPKAKSMLAMRIKCMSKDEKDILMKTQLILRREKFVTQAIANEEIIHNISRLLPFYLSCYSKYLSDLSKMTK